MVEKNESGEKPLNRRQLSKIRTREGVLIAGRVLFMEGGYTEATIRDIAKRIKRAGKPPGMSTGAVFANFDNKADLLLAIAQEDLGFHKELLERTASEGGTVLDRIVKICTSDFVFFKDRLNLMEALATLETLVEPEKKDSLATSRRARAITEERRALIRKLVWAQLNEAHGSLDMITTALATIIVSAHVDFGRQAALDGLSAGKYQNNLQEHLIFLLSPIGLNLAA